MFRRRSLDWIAVLAATVTVLCASTAATAQPVVQEDFNSVTGTGGGPLLFGDGFSLTANWDDGLVGENAFAGTTERARIDSTVQGLLTGGPDASGAGQISVSNILFNPVHRDFADVQGFPGATFADSNGIGEGYTANWDDGIDGEAAFGVVTDGAVLNGRMRAQALVVTQQARIEVRDVDVTSGSWSAGLIFDAPPLEGAVSLINPGFEDSATEFVGWTPFGANNYVASEYVHSGSNSYKKFGEFSGTYNASGIYQELPAQEGQTWQLDCWTAHIAGDALTGSTNDMVMNIEFYDGGGVLLNTNGPQVVLDGNSPTNTWIDNTPLELTAPAGTAVARALLMFRQPAGEGGAAHIDDVTFQVVAGPSQSNVDLSSIDLTADIMGIANAGAGETVGNFQLRIEDPEGDRLIYYGATPTSMTTVGGPLSTFTEADSNGVPTADVFNDSAPSYRIVVAFDNEPAVTWGTGGEMIIDNVILTGDSVGDSAWYAGAFWNNLTLTTSNLDELYVSADIAASVAGGAYQLRVEGAEINTSGVAATFSDVATVGYDLITYDMVEAEIYSNYTGDWHPELFNEVAWGGFGTGTELCDNTSPAECQGLEDIGITLDTINTDGHDDSSCGRIKMAGLWTQPAGADWYAGVGWLNQQLASTDLSQVSLSAWVKGEADFMWGQQLGSIELRIEDAQRDRLYKQVTADGSWQFIGGTLDTFTEDGAAGGGGDGNFDLDSPSYTVAIAFDQPFATWFYGGAILFDEVTITPFEVTREVGNISFSGTGVEKAGGFTTIGGLLSEGISTFVSDFIQDFNTVVGDVTPVWPETNWRENWESGLEGEAAFAGTWGSGIITTMTAQGCLDCGTNGTGAAQMVLNNANDGGLSGGWWAGLVFPGLRADLSTADFSEIQFTAKVKVTATGPGAMLGTYTLRLEDPDTNFYGFDVTATGDWQDVGGALSEGITGTGDGDGSFDFLAGSYNAVLVVTNGTGYNTWGDGTIEVTIDNMFLTLPGNSFADAEVYTVAVAFDQEIATWPIGGTLTFDNVSLVQSGSPDCDLDGDIDLRDFAYFQACFTGEGGGVPTGCECADLNSDGNVDLGDYGLVNLRMEGPQ